MSWWKEIMWYFRIGWDLEESAEHVSRVFRRDIWRHKKTGERRSVNVVQW